MRISDWSSDVCSSDLAVHRRLGCLLAQLFLHVEERGNVVGAAVDQQDDVPAELRAHRGSRVLTRLERQRGPGEVRRHATGMEVRSEEHTSELQSLMRISYAVLCLKKKKKD